MTKKVVCEWKEVKRVVIGTVGLGNRLLAVRLFQKQLPQQPVLINAYCGVVMGVLYSVGVGCSRVVSGMVVVVVVILGVFVSIFSRIGCVLGVVLIEVGGVVVSCGDGPRHLVGRVCVLGWSVGRLR